MNTLNIGQLAGLAAAIAISLMPPAALAHGKLESAVPASGSTVDVGPESLQLNFNERLEPTFSYANVSDASGAPITKEKAKVDTSDPRVMTVAVPRLATGTYTVKWGVMTADAHKTNGTYTFKVK
ncbi:MULTISPECIES: copper homeostasis periplasmic binding protein CopC [unclassified Paraburkholderia]|uniref:copper homeostasis periplasmic binding protein CopC n=1 Tax=unclassified Paraburkholderia TaxID=2615204 RepID=UPI002AB690E9|nr:MULTISPECIES: copper homeostasis periplasmic binding protein CopC [unclassified Paraburkholderia]